LGLRQKVYLKKALRYYWKIFRGIQLRQLYGRSREELQNGLKFEFTGQKRRNHSCVFCSSVDKVTRGAHQSRFHKIGMDEIMQQNTELLKSAGFCTLIRNKADSEDYRQQEYIPKKAFKKPRLSKLPSLVPHFRPSQLTNAFGNFGPFTTQAQPVATSAEELIQASFPVSSHMDQVGSFPEEFKQENFYDASFTSQIHQLNFSSEKLMQMNLMLCNGSNVAHIDSMSVSDLHAKNKNPQEDEGLKNNPIMKRSKNTQHSKNERSLVSSFRNNNNMAIESFSDFDWLKFQEQTTCLSSEEDTENMQTKNYSKTSTGKRKSSLSKYNPGKFKNTVERKCAVREKKRCANSGCLKFAQTGGKCVAHGGGKRCLEADCNKYALFGGKCYAHGVRKVCTVIDCTKSAMPRRGKCFVHGGSKRCTIEGCAKYAKIGGTCVSHGGGRRCLEIGCAKSAQAGGRCVNHGGGKRCSEAGCPKSAKTGGKCIAHGGGKRCSELGCTKSVQVGGKCIAHGNNIDLPSVCTLSEMSYWWL